MSYISTGGGAFLEFLEGKKTTCGCDARVTCNLVHKGKPLTALRRTKIVATLGPATNSPGVLDAIIKGGVDVVRLNFSHGDVNAHLFALAERILSTADKVAEEHGRHAGILADLQGPKIRIARFREGRVILEVGQDQQFALDAGLGSHMIRR